MFTFAGYSFDPKLGLAFGERAIALPPKERDLLQFLLSAKGKIVSKDEVVQAVWRGGVASDESISRAVYRLRLAMQAAGGPPVVTTVYNGGYRIACPILHTPEIHAVHSTAPSGSSASNRHSVVLPMMLSGREFAARQTPQDLRIALEAARAATALDPQYPPAWVTLAELHILQAMRGVAPALECGQQAKDAANKALDIEATCAPAIAMRGWVQALIERRLAPGLEDLEHALKYDPHCWRSFVLKAAVMQALGDHEAAISMARRAQGLNAFAITASAALPLYLLLAGRANEAQSCAQDLVQRFPNLDSVQDILSVVLSAQGQHEQALIHAHRAAELSPHTPLMQTQLAYALARTGRSEEARHVLAALRQGELPPPWASMAPVYLALEEPQTCLELLAQARAQGQPQFYALRDDPRLLALRGEPAFIQLWG